MSESGPSSKTTNLDRLVRFETPLSGLFAINKPSGMVSMSLLNSLQPLFSRSPLFTDGKSIHPADCTATGIPKSKRKRAKSRRHPLVKIGQGGTLDPLASGVLVVGLNSATKKLSAFLNCTKSYRTTGLLGCETDSYDQMGKVIRLVSWKGVSPEDIKNQCIAMKGPGWQLPPIYSALKMDGKPLYEYARNNIPLPRPIEARPCDIPEVELVNWQDGGKHTYKWPTQFITPEDQEMFDKLQAMIAANGISKPQAPEPTNIQPISSPASRSSLHTKRLHSPDTAQDDTSPKKLRTEADSGESSVDLSAKISSQANSPKNLESEVVTMADNGLSPAFTLEMTVSSGTYVRTIVHDIGKAVSSAATVVSLTRTRQGEFALEADTEKYPGTNGLGCIEWSVFERAIEAERDGTIEARSEVDGLRDWERELLKKIKT
ncbi:hypothetical protein CROQUDRAFT_66808 [Cronartium quercuum f. sp. fusiforme G11]|uniref:tRNA pseudouridine(55) synthase n=1 Tax=Cronartium quercuum f. sp. fusiforme G11 TaxID=708437 RepID=A0A9P6T8P8_9BASI|nr:hypothetical protein CROQUDRAFT_66808 [Cronartium quercuum f. sp. fusiforme G11]